MAAGVEGATLRILQSTEIHSPFPHSTCMVGTLVGGAGDTAALHCLPLLFEFSLGHRVLGDLMIW